MFKNQEITHHLYGSAQFTDQLDHLNRLYADFGQVSPDLAPELDHLTFLNRSHLLRTTDGYVWSTGFIGQVSGTYGEKLGILILFPKKDYVNKLFKPERSIAIFLKHPRISGYKKFLQDFLFRFRKNHLFFHKSAKILKRSFSAICAGDERGFPYCDICNKRTKEKTFYIANCGIGHKTCIENAICFNTLYKS